MEPRKSNDPNEGNGSSNGGADSAKLEIEGKVYTAEDVQNLLAQRKAEGTKVEQASAALKAAERYGVGVDQLIEHMEGSFSVFNDLKDKGIIDSAGNLIEKSANSPTPKEANLDALFGEPQAKGPQPLGANDKTVAALQQAIEGLTGKLSKVESENSQLFRLHIEGQMKTKYPDMAPQEISQAIARAANDPQKQGLDFHAKALIGEKQGYQQTLRQQHAKEFGVNLEEFDANKLNEQDDKGGGSALFKGKKFSFTKKGADYIHPSEAAATHFDKNI